MSYIPGDMAMWFDSFLKMIDLLLNFIYFVQNRNWHGYLEAIYMFLSYCFFLNRQNYAKKFKLLLYRHARTEIKQSTSIHIFGRGWVLRITVRFYFSNICMDQVIESTINHFSKSVGGLTGKTEHGCC